jgi:hypothetical protein
VARRRMHIVLRIQLTVNEVRCACLCNRTIVQKHGLAAAGADTESSERVTPQLRTCAQGECRPGCAARQSLESTAPRGADA